MPHIVLEYSDNAIESGDVRPLLARLHEALAAAGVDKSRIKARAIHIKDFCIGSEPENRDACMMHLTLSLLEGRSIEVRQAYAASLFQILKNAAKTECLVTVDIREMCRETYMS